MGAPDAAGSPLCLRPVSQKLSGGVGEANRRSSDIRLFTGAVAAILPNEWTRGYSINRFLSAAATLYDAETAVTIVGFPREHLVK